MKCLALATAVPIAPDAPRAALHRHAATVLLLASATALLSACGGGGGGGNIISSPPPIAATPAPAPTASPTPAPVALTSIAVETVTIPSPATRQATYDTFALIEHTTPGGAPSSRLAAPSDVRIAAHQPGPSQYDLTYTIQFAKPDLPGGLSSLSAVIEGRSHDYFLNGGFGGYRDATKGQYPLLFGQTQTATGTYSDGSLKVLGIDRYSLAQPDQTNALVGVNRFYYNKLLDVGFSHVSLGFWNWGLVEPFETPGGANFIEGGLVRFVYGDRSPASAIPTSGTASYTATTLEYGDPDWASGIAGISVSHQALRFALTVDFGQRSISAQISQEFNSFGCGDCFFSITPGLDLNGTGSIAGSGNFTIPLTGAMTSYVQGVDSASVATFAVRGALDGAFFGPNAEQVGGVFAVGLTPGTALFSDAFVGTRN